MLSWYSTSCMHRCASLLQRPLCLAQLNEMCAQVIVNGLNQDTFLMPKLIMGLVASGESKVACDIFCQVDHPNAFLCTSLMRIFSSRGLFKEAVFIYKQMRARTVPLDNYSFPFVLKSCGGCEALFEGKQIHANIMRSGFVSDVYVQTSLLDMYAKCRQLEACKLVLGSMTEKNVVSWTVMIQVYCQNGFMEEAEELFDNIPVKNIVTWNTIIDGWARLGNMETAKQFFVKMPQRNSASWTTMIIGYSRTGDMENARLMFDQMGNTGREVIAWTAMISGYSMNGNPEKALEHFEEMLAAKVKPDAITMLSVVSATAQLGSLELSQWVGHCVVQFGLWQDIRVQNALVNMYVQCGCLDRAFQAFEMIPKKDVVSYNSIIAGLATHGDLDRALSVFSMMTRAKVRPNSRTFVGLLTACAHRGSLDQGKKYFKLMLELGYIEPRTEHYTCMVDLLGRAGHLDEAHRLVLKMPMGPHASTWGALLGACRIHGNLNLAEVVANQLFEMEPDNAGNYTILANMYAEAKRWVKADEVRRLMKDEQLVKDTGSSWTEIFDLAPRQEHAFP